MLAVILFIHRPRTQPSSPGLVPTLLLSARPPCSALVCTPCLTKWPFHSQSLAAPLLPAPLCSSNITSGGRKGDSTEVGVSRGPVGVPLSCMSNKGGFGFSLSSQTRHTELFFRPKQYSYLPKPNIRFIFKVSTIIIHAIIPCHQNK